MQVQAAGASDAPAPIEAEDGGSLDSVSFDAPRDRHDLGDVTLPVRAPLDVAHKVDGRGQGRGHESRRHILARQERQD